MKLVVICQVVLAVRVSASLLSHQKSVVSLSDDTLQHTTHLSTQSNCKLSEAEASAAIARHTLPHTQHTLTLSARTSCDTAIVDASRYCMQGHEQAGRGSRIAFKQPRLRCCAMEGRVMLTASSSTLPASAVKVMLLLNRPSQLQAAGQLGPGVAKRLPVEMKL